MQKNVPLLMLADFELSLSRAYTYKQHLPVCSNFASSDVHFLKKKLLLSLSLSLSDFGSLTQNQGLRFISSVKQKKVSFWNACASTMNLLSDV